MTTTLLNNGLRIPSVGLGVYKASPEDTYKTVLAALKAGYRHIDTAAFYQNEPDVGRAIKESGIPRSEIWVTTKLHIGEMRNPTEAFNKSLERLGTGYIDLYLIHAPIQGRRLQAWKEMEVIYQEGKAKSIGVSNFNIAHLEELINSSTVVPAVNQIELNPFLQHVDITEFCKSKGIVVQAYSPLTKARKLDDPTLVEVSTGLGKTPAQVLIKWGLQKGYVTLPKTVNPTRLVENISVFDWTISAEDMKKLDALECNFVTEWDPTQWGTKNETWGQWAIEKVIHNFVA
ncbi:2,5-didehydrogluconate reductase [Rhizoclosmatium globosum]|uniref:2,5-didehydrogluconate reductase n=1 Tax=Rhizoclosmatium globosum TaxID=329046 RepID=A0A1Y2CWC9_9FUNG|nr:2,5-didehydrogluconate reductase [Rhizoclosmatium globosum]|eukprot:ORY51333.1 2,5-didehydrogluconate reductase [Rhizoclosmatium globosum]